MALFSARVWTSSQGLRSLYAGFFQLPLLPEAVLAAADYRVVRRMFALMPAQKSPFGADDIQRYVACLSRPGALKAALDYYRENMRSDGMALAASVHTEAETLRGQLRMGGFAKLPYYPFTGCQASNGSRPCPQ